MTEDVKKVLQNLLAKVPGIYSVIISDRDGVPVLAVDTEKAPEAAMRPSFLSTFGLAIDQGGKLGLGKTNKLICSYSKYQLVQMNLSPLIVSFVASDSCNTGHILALEQQLEPILSILKTVAEM